MVKKVLVFDCFGVIAPPVLMGWLSNNVGERFDPSELLSQFDMGDITEDEAIYELAGLVSRDPAIVRSEIDSYFKVNIELVDLITSFRAKNFKIVLLTNAHHTFFERFVFVEYPWFKDLFDDIIISSKIKMIKPSKDIFLYVLDRHNVKPEDVVFIDDSNVNVGAATELGINSIQYKDIQTLKEELGKYDIR